jgi:hypothetical protein
MPLVACLYRLRNVSEVKMPKLSRSPGLEPPLHAQRHGGVVHRRLLLLGRARLHHQLQRLARAVDLLEVDERHDDEGVLRVAEERPLLLADADHAERHALDPDDLFERVVLPEQPVRGVPADDGHGGAAVPLRWGS